MIAEVEEVLAFVDAPRCERVRAGGGACLATLRPDNTCPDASDHFILECATWG